MLNTLKRIEAEKNGGKDEKALYKLMDNAVYGKTIENLRNRIDVSRKKQKLFNMDIQTKLYVTKIFDNELVAMRKNKVTLTLKISVYIGMCILEWSKVLMYEFHYDYIKNKYDNNSSLLLRDTDSLMYEIKTEDIYEDSRDNKEIFDFSKYSTKLKCYDN